MYTFLSDVETVLDQHAISYNEYIEPDHVTIFTNEMMRDPGFSYDNKLLDIFIENDHQMLFIGLLRLPLTYRRRHIGIEIVKNLLTWANENGYTTFLDSCGDSTPFWHNCGFQLIKYHDGFYTMGFGQLYKEKWKQHGQHLFADFQ
ncbi:hypothetical protein [Robertmurraya sp.]|uniref:hypothetical protein n=1 Tax=Robertmurraya sp. TaxID=2837525 RepID=UPI0037048558